jgi:hypothetical protein
MVRALSDRLGVHVLEELEAAAAVWRLQQRDFGVVAVESRRRLLRANTRPSGGLFRATCRLPTV